MSFELETDSEAIDAFLRERQWLAADERVTGAALAGEGNMTRTVRIRTTQRSLVLKQSRPYCVKFPDIPAPIERLATEVRFYRVASTNPILAGRMPRVLAFDEKEFVAVLEDLGEASDLLGCYAGDPFGRADLEVLCEFARELHALPVGDEDRAALANHAMRELNHEHIFELPFDPDNGLDLDALTPGLAELAAKLQADDAYVAEIVALGMLYTNADGPSLLHGDYYPGSFLRTGGGLRVIDPEFGFIGPAEFDLGVLAAHLVFAGGEHDVIDRIGAAYARAFDRKLLAGFAGAELARRLLGVAQLPLVADLECKRGWLELSHRWLTGRA
ncbi:MAG: phosphotransferase [Myxococcota bacterium]|nr:phosphotransferase [Myxococcota bacterium]